MHLHHIKELNIVTYRNSHRLELTVLINITIFNEYFYISNTDSFCSHFKRYNNHYKIFFYSDHLFITNQYFIITNLRNPLHVVLISSLCGHLIIYFSLFDIQFIYTSDKNLVSKSFNESKPVENINIEILKRLLTIINIKFTPSYSTFMPCHCPALCISKLGSATAVDSVWLQHFM